MRSMVLTRFLAHLMIALSFFGVIFALSSLAIRAEQFSEFGATLENRLPTRYMDEKTLRVLVEIQGTSVLMAVAYLFGSIGAYLRQAMEYIGLTSASGETTDLVNYFETRGIILRAVVGGIFGVVSLLAIESGLVAKLIFENTSGSIKLDPTFSGIAIISFFVGTFGGETFFAAKARVQQLAGAKNDN